MFSHTRTCRTSQRALSIISSMIVSLGGLPLPNVFDPHECRESFSAPPRRTNARDFAVDYLRSSFLSKWGSLRLGIDTKQVALNAFEESERRCRRTNELWDAVIPMTSEFYFRRAQGLIERVLGRTPPSLRDLPLLISNGATVDVRRSDPPSDKLNIHGSRGISATLPLALAVDREEVFPHGLHINLVPGSRLTTVPKSFKTDRVIAIEPTLNGMVQRAYGQYIRRRLLDVAGIDLRIQQGVHRKLLQTSYTPGIATIDFKAASDSIAFQVVRRLLPVNWFEALATCSSPRYELNGEWREFEKFSSMGNGFTFELETLLFWALAKACGSDIAGVYGDDVIVESELATLVTNVGDDFGFEVNVQKTFSEGPFRESCGFDSFMGQQVTPFRLKGRTLKVIDDVFWLHNELIRWAERSPLTQSCYQIVRETVSQLRGLLKPRDLLLGPEGYGDSWLISNFSEARPSVRRDKRGWQGYIVRSLNRIYERKEFPDVDSLFVRYMASRRDDYPLVLLPPLGTHEPLGKIPSGLPVGAYQLVRSVTFCRDWPELWTMVP